ncbi:MAG: type VII secretion protein EccB [Nocardioides sp.]
MATKKDLVEAYSFSRRRLVTAFVSGAPGGREVEPAKPGRSIIGGLALAVLLIAGAAIAGVFTSNVDPAWAESPGLVISKEGAEVFIITTSSTEPVLHPILNITSAKLILGSGGVEPEVIPEEYIAEEEIGSDLGIFGAPYDVPDVDRLIQSGWTACTDGVGLRLDVSEDELVTPAPPDGGMLATVDRETWLVAVSRPAEDGSQSAVRYLVPRAGSSEQDLVRNNLGLAENEPVEVSREWLNLFPEGEAISSTSFGVTPRVGKGNGEPRPGDLLSISGTTYLTLASGELAPLDPFSLTVAQGSAGGDTPPDYAGDIGPLDLDGNIEVHWPGTTLRPVFGERCARLVTDPGEPSVVQLVQEPEGDAAATDTNGESATVDAGAGAFVQSGGWGQASDGESVVIDSKGVAYPVVDGLAVERLGFAGYDVPVVPDSWVELFVDGVALSQNAALCAPRTDRKPCA